jgi:hypothetical protein
MPFKCDLALRNIPLSKQPFQNATLNWNEDVIWSLQCTLPTTITNKCRALSLQEVELDGRFLILHIVPETCTISVMHTFNMSIVFYFYILRFTSWIWTNPSIEELKFESPSKWNSYEGFNLEHWCHPWSLVPNVSSLAPYYNNNNYYYYIQKAEKPMPNANLRGFVSPLSGRVFHGYKILWPTLYYVWAENHSGYNQY